MLTIKLIITANSFVLAFFPVYLCFPSDFLSLMLIQTHLSFYLFTHPFSTGYSQSEMAFENGGKRYI